jgi:hypothetical protein
MLTLFVVPVVYTLLDDAAAWLSSRRRVRPARVREVAPARPVPEAAGAGD